MHKISANNESWSAGSVLEGGSGSGALRSNRFGCQLATCALVRCCSGMATFTIRPSFSKEEKIVTNMYIEQRVGKFKNAEISNLSDNFLFIFSVRLVGLVNFVSREYEPNRY